MRNKIFTLLIGSFISFSCFAQNNEIEIEEITPQIYKIYYQRGNYTTNMVVFYGNDGLLLVDAGQEEEAEDLKVAILKKWGQLPDIIINTHEHVDHTGGNAVFDGKPLIIAQSKVRENLTSGYYIFDEFPDYSLPHINIEDSLKINFNGEEIHLISIPGAHSQDDIIVWFKNSKVMCIGDLAYKGYFPSYDDPRGVLRFPEIAQEIHDIAPDSTIFISGHYGNLTKNDLTEFKIAMEKTIELVLNEHSKGKTYNEMVEANLLKDWEHYGQGYASTNEWIEAIISSQSFDASKKVFNEELYKLYKSGSYNAIEKKYFELKCNHPDEYYFFETILTGIAQKLIHKKQYEAAIVFLNLEMKDYPNGQYKYYNHYLLGNIYIDLDEKEKALQEYEKALELYPDSKAIKKKIELLKNH